MLGLRAMFDALGDHKEFVRAEESGNEAGTDGRRDVVDGGFGAIPLG